MLYVHASEESAKNYYSFDVYTQMKRDFQRKVLNLVLLFKFYLGEYFTLP